MRKIILSVCLLALAAHFSEAQIIQPSKPKRVGVNTDYPKTTFHVDAKKNNGTGANPVNIADDVTFDAGKPLLGAPYGYVGVGKVDPSAALDVEGSIVLQDGTQKAGYMLVSQDALGNAKWVSSPRSAIEVGKLKEDHNDVGVITESAKDLTDTPLRLPEGKWLVISKFVVKRYVSNPEIPRSNMWIYLNNETTSPGSNPPFNSIIGASVEQAGEYTGTPQLVAIVNVPKGETHEFRIYGSTSNKGMSVASDFQGSLFYAVRLDQELLN